MEKECVPELGKAYLDELAAVLLEIESLPLVNPPVKLSGEPGDKPTNIKVYANLKAEFVELPKSRQPKVCSSMQRPTHLDMARALLQKLYSSDKGGYAEELVAAANATAKAAACAGEIHSRSLAAVLPCVWRPPLAHFARGFECTGRWLIINRVCADRFRPAAGCACGASFTEAECERCRTGGEQVARH